MELRLRDGLGLPDLPGLAEGYEADLREEVWEERTRCQEAAEAARKRGRMRESELRTIVSWKSNRAAHHVDDNPEGYVEEVTEAALSSSGEDGSDRFRLEVLTLLSGVRSRVASAVAYFLWGPQYPVFDWRALESLSVPRDEQRYQIEDYLEYMETCRDLATNGGDLSARQVDMALWKYSKEHGPLES